mgnify:CR=1 FL=1|tara:strand:+ start:349 stop:939 length:591 start_codon:yes stop_codon:yes gene_type:complete
MKKVLFFIALATFSFASAQITTNAGTFNKPSEGETAFEFQFMPNLDGTTMFADTGMTVMMRRFSSDTKAVRWSASLDVADSGVEGSDMTYAVGLGYGIENHFSGAERLSTYWGYGGSLGYADGGGNSTDDDGNVVETDGTFGIGANVFLGADYYIIPKVYIGVEMSYGLGLTSGNDITAWGLTGGVNGMMRVGFRL